jgi:RimJ/RimL family protein N-acetyltransferase
LRVFALEKIKPEWHRLIWKWRSEPETLKHNPLKKMTLAQWQERIDIAGDDLTLSGKSEYLFAICKNSQPVGMISLNTISYDQGYANLGYSLSRTYFGQGIASKALALFVEKVFRTTSLRRLQATTAIENIASWKVLEKNGFSREGILKEYFIINKRPVDHYLYARLKKC